MVLVAPAALEPSVPRRVSFVRSVVQDVVSRAAAKLKPINKFFIVYL
jgi:hypothetical protein